MHEKKDRPSTHVRGGLAIGYSALARCLRATRRDQEPRCTGRKPQKEEHVRTRPVHDLERSAYDHGHQGADEHAREVQLNDHGSGFAEQKEREREEGQHPADEENVAGARPVQGLEKEAQDETCDGDGSDGVHGDGVCRIECRGGAFVTSQPKSLALPDRHQWPYCRVHRCPSGA